MAANNTNKPDNLVCLMSLPQDQAFDILHYYKDHGLDYVTMESEQIIGIYDILVPESKIQEIQAYTDDFFKNPQMDMSDTDTSEAKPVSGNNEKESAVAKSSIYYGKAAALENTRSSAYTFMLVGGIGIIVSVLLFLGIIPLPVNDLMPIVLIAMSAVFFIIGISNYRKISALEEEASRESSQTSGILQWFQTTYTADDIDSHCQLTDSEETNYFQRAEYIRELLLMEYTLDDDYLDTLIDPIYSCLFD